VKGPVSVIADVGVGNIFQRGTCCPPAILGGYLSGETADDKYAKRVTAPQRRRPHDCHAHSQTADWLDVASSLAKILPRDL